MNRSRLMREVNDLRLDLGKILNSALGEWYDVRVSANNTHVADRILDRSTDPAKGFGQVREILEELCKYYPSNLLHFAVKSKTEGLQDIVVYKRVSPVQIFAVVLTTKIIENPEQPLPVMVVTIRTMVSDYTAPLANKNTIEVDYKAPKIVFEYEGFRRRLSRLERLIAGDDCPPALRVLRN